MWLTLKRNGLWLLLWILSTGAFALAGAGILDWSRFYWLSKRGVQIDGRVTSLEPENHNAVYYAYAVNGEGYGGIGAASKIHRDSATMKVGETVPVVYDAADPGFSWLGDPNQELSSRTNGVIFLAAVPTLAFFVLYLKGAMRSKAAT
jgi:hypothetical protein